MEVERGGEGEVEWGSELYGRRLACLDCRVDKQSDYGPGVLQNGSSFQFCESRPHGFYEGDAVEMILSICRFFITFFISWTRGSLAAQMGTLYVMSLKPPLPKYLQGPCHRLVDGRIRRRNPASSVAHSTRGMEQGEVS